MSEHQPVVPDDSSPQDRARPWQSVGPDQSVLERALDAVTVRRVFGEAYELDGATVIPVAHVRGGGGGGGGAGQQGGETGSGSGLGFGLSASPAGVYVVQGQAVTWQPAVDPARIALPLGLVALAVLGVVGRAVGTRRA